MGRKVKKEIESPDGDVNDVESPGGDVSDIDPPRLNILKVKCNILEDGVLYAVGGEYKGKRSDYFLEKGLIYELRDVGGR
jgi:hypothetical protein